MVKYKSKKTFPYYDWLIMSTAKMSIYDVQVQKINLNALKCASFVVFFILYYKDNSQTLTSTYAHVRMKMAFKLFKTII